MSAAQSFVILHRMFWVVSVLTMREVSTLITFGELLCSVEVWANISMKSTSFCDKDTSAPALFDAGIRIQCACDWIVTPHHGRLAASDRKTVGLMLFWGLFYNNSLTFVLTTRSSRPLRAFSSVWLMKNDFRGRHGINQSCFVHIALVDSFYIVFLARRHACTERRRVVWTSVMETWGF